MTKIIAAIDPGQNGAWAVHGMGDETFTYVEARKGCSVKDLVDDLKASGVTFVIMEELATITGKGTATTWTTSAKDWGGIYHCLLMSGIGVKTVTSGAWKRHFNLTGKDKKDSIKLAKQFFPSLSLLPTEKSKVDDHNMAEALLILKYGIEKGVYV